MKKIIFIVVLLLCFLAVGGYVIPRYEAGFDITIKNQTEKKISHLKITYHNIASDIEIPPIQPNKIYKLKVTPTEEFSENTMKLFYKDDKGNKHTERLIGYFEQGYSGSSIVTIQSVNKRCNSDGHHGTSQITTLLFKGRHMLPFYFVLKSMYVIKSDPFLVFGFKQNNLIVLLKRTNA
ncbi:hypothetical protein [Fictibacillus barbaricus]|uniref:Uncharacterized protein n=1 Tax=Fictibacillus barbaricus TaxID=182136 RepID=A0ABU1U1V8_9BACL|nr:hypothetical protein [Fictibacillus barbaricus]MDR7073386.1 hypothetical protein [Fictibacillus barbaricus]